MNHYDLADAHAHHWQDYPDQYTILEAVSYWRNHQTRDVWVESIIFGLDDDSRWYATAYCAGKLPDKGNKN